MQYPSVLRYSGLKQGVVAHEGGLSKGGLLYLGGSSEEIQIYLFHQQQLEVNLFLLLGAKNLQINKQLKALKLYHLFNSTDIKICI